LKNTLPLIDGYFRKILERLPPAYSFCTTDTEMRHYVLDELEHRWGGFLIDLNARELLPLFEKLKLKSKVTAFGEDPATVHEAWVEYRTIVTVNESHFVRDILEHQKRDSGSTCKDCWGLLAVPDRAIARERLLRNVKTGMTIGGSIIPWPAAAYANLCVSLHLDGSVGVRRFRRCVHCQRGAPIKAGWYQGLAEVGRRGKVNSGAGPVLPTPA
jgi:hypothetical protein